MNNIVFLPIILFFISSFLISNTRIVYKKEQTTVNILTVVFPIFLFGLYLIGFRPLDAGGDTSAYINAYNRLETLQGAVVEANYGRELLYWPIQYILKSFFSERVWLIANYIFIFLFSMFAYKKVTKDTSLSWTIVAFIFFTYFGPYAGNAMRQAVAVPFVVLAFYSLGQNQYKKYFLYCLLAIGLHLSSIILLFSIFFTRLPNRTHVYIVVPLMFLALSLLLTPIFSFITSNIGLPWLNEKINLYLYGGRISHISAVYKTLNFWLCITIYCLLLITTTFKKTGGEKTMKFLMMIISIMLFFISNADLSERNMVYFLFMIPIAVTLLFDRLKFPSVFKNLLYLTQFTLLSFLVYNNQSAQETLGLL